MKKLAVTVVFGALIYLGPAGRAYSQPAFYQDKTITVVAGRAPGGTGDMRLRAVISVLRKHIPGNPSIAIEYMPGGGGRMAGNYLYKAARPDGLTIGSMSNGFVPAALLGDAGIFYSLDDLDKVTYLGSYFSDAAVAFLTRKEAGLSGREKLRTALGVRIGTQPVGHTLYLGSRVFAYVMGMTEPKFIPGYNGPELDQALMKGEVDARVNTVDSLIQRKPQWVEKNLVDFHAVIEIPKGRRHSHPNFATISDLEDFARSDRDRSFVAIYRAFRMIGFPLVLPPNTPKANAQILQHAMRRALRDPEFSREYRKLSGEEPEVLMPEDLEKTIRDLPRQPDIIEQFKKFAGSAPLPALLDGP